MIEMDRYAHQSPLREISPALKCVFALGSLLICAGGQSPAVCLLVFGVMGWVSIQKAGAGMRDFLRLCSIPFWFVLIGVLTIAVQVSKTPEGIAWVKCGAVWLVLTPAALFRAVLIFLRSMAGVSCLCFLYLSTPVSQLLGLLERLHVPEIVRELMLLTYRFIFILLDRTALLFTAQKSRLGHAGMAGSLRSLGILGGTVLIKSFQHASGVLCAMESRGYDGTVRYLGQIAPARKKDWIFLGLYLVGLTVLALECARWGV